MFCKKQQKEKNSEAQRVTVRCETCIKEGKKCQNEVTTDMLKLRPTGYKGNFQVYMHCSKCNKDVVIPYSTLPEHVKAKLKRRWIKECNNF